jgi:hypothetical protein
MPTADGDESRLDLSLGKIVGYVAAALLLYSGATRFETDVISGGLRIALGVLALPFVRAQLSTSTRVALSRWAKVLVVIFIIVLSDAVLGVELLPDRLSEVLRELLV